MIYKIFESLCCTPETNIVNQLYLNKIKFFKNTNWYFKNNCSVFFKGSNQVYWKTKTKGHHRLETKETLTKYNMRIWIELQTKKRALVEQLTNSNKVYVTGNSIVSMLVCWFWSLWCAFVRYYHLGKLDERLWKFLVCLQIFCKSEMI